MRPALRLLASVLRSTQEPGAPTGLTGLLTHSAPRSTLLYLYGSTLEVLKGLPESSVYRQSTETLTKHRMKIIESSKPAGLEEWQKRVQATVDEYPHAFMKIPLSTQPGSSEYNIVWKPALDELDGDVRPEPPPGPTLEGARSAEVQEVQLAALTEDHVAEDALIPYIEPEPSLTAEQINEIEQKLGAGLIEEVIQVAEGEKLLAYTMAEHKVWEELEEKPVEGQWTYHARGTHTPQTQAH